jgi:hypothetical protein
MELLIRHGNSEQGYCPKKYVCSGLESLWRFPTLALVPTHIGDEGQHEDNLIEKSRYRDRIGG